MAHILFMIEADFSVCERFQSIPPIPPELMQDLNAWNIIHANQQKPSLLPLPDHWPRPICSYVFDQFCDLPLIMNIPRTIKFGHLTLGISGVYNKLRKYSAMIMYAVINFIILPVPDGL